MLELNLTAMLADDLRVIADNFHIFSDRFGINIDIRVMFAHLI